MTGRLNVAVVGATGAVGTAMLRVLRERRFPVRRIRLLASTRSAGRRVPFNGSLHRIEALSARAFNGIDVALFSAGAARSHDFAPEAVRRGALVVDNSSAFRLDPRVPLVVPEVNPDALRGHHGLIANPNCSTIILLVPLAPLHRAARITRITVATYQSVSGAGAQAMAQLAEETPRALRGVRLTRVRLDADPRLARPAGPLPAQIAFNLIPQVDAFLGNRYTKEEMKLVLETRKILGAPSLPISATCVRVPVFAAHSEAVWIETARPLSVAQAERLLRAAPGVRLIDTRKPGGYPQPVLAAGQDDVLVGRIRRDLAARRGLALWVSGDNLRKGAATNAIQIAELACGRSD